MHNNVSVEALIAAVSLVLCRQHRSPRCHGSRAAADNRRPTISSGRSAKNGRGKRYSDCTAGESCFNA